MIKLKYIFIFFFLLFLNNQKALADYDPSPYCKKGKEELLIGYKLHDSGQYADARNVWKKAISLGCAWAAFEISGHYYKGTYDVQHNEYEQFKWVKICSDLGDIKCKFFVGQMLIDGKGTKKNIKKGCRLLKQGLLSLNENERYAFTVLNPDCKF